MPAELPPTGRRVVQAEQMPRDVRELLAGRQLRRDVLELLGLLLQRFLPRGELRRFFGRNEFIKRSEIVAGTTQMCNECAHNGLRKIPQKRVCARSEISTDGAVTEAFLGHIATMQKQRSYHVREILHACHADTRHGVLQRSARWLYPVDLRAMDIVEKEPA